MTDPRFWVGFNLIPQIGPAKVQRLIEFFGDLEIAWAANAFDLARAGLDKRALENVITARRDLDLDAVYAKSLTACDRILTWDHADYPKRLKQVPYPPPVLYIKGAFAPEDEWALGVVGTRRASAYGHQVAQCFVKDLVQSGLTVVSGLARGIDAEAHRAALENGGRTIAVMGSGIDVIYPPEHKRLAESIAANGAVITEYPVGAKPDAANFPPRNRIISGLSLGVLMIEGDETSGAMITTEFALEQDREVFAVPGSIFHREARGPNKLIRESRAKLVTQVQDILEELNLTMIAEQAQARAIVPENPTEAALLDLLSADPVHIDDLCRQSGLPVAEVSSTLALMELKGLCRQVGGMNYVLAH